MPAPTPDDIKGYALQLLRSGESPPAVHAAVVDRFRDRPADQLPSERTIVNWKTADRKQQKEALAAGGQPLAPQTLPPREALPRTADGQIDIARAHAQQIRHGLALQAAAHEIEVAWVERISRGDGKLNGTELQHLAAITSGVRTTTTAYLKAEEDKEEKDPLDELLSQLTKDQLKRLVAGESIPLDEQPA